MSSYVALSLILEAEPLTEPEAHCSSSNGLVINSQDLPVFKSQLWNHGTLPPKFSFFIDSGVLKSDCHAWATSTLPTEPHSQLLKFVIYYSNRKLTNMVGVVSGVHGFQGSMATFYLIYLKAEEGKITTINAWE